MDKGNRLKEIPLNLVNEEFISNLDIGALFLRIKTKIILLF